MTMNNSSYYRKHIFFCINQRETGKQCCQNAGADQMREYAKQKIKALNLAMPGEIRINAAGCMGRCAEGPVMVIYPEAIWYTYRNQQDIDEIIEQHILQGKIVERLLLPSIYADNSVG